MPLSRAATCPMCPRGYRAGAKQQFSLWAQGTSWDRFRHVAQGMQTVFFSSHLKKNRKDKVCVFALGHETRRDSLPTMVSLAGAVSSHSGSICLLGQSQETTGMRNQPEPGVKIRGRAQETGPHYSSVSESVSLPFFLSFPAI